MSAAQARFRAEQADWLRGAARYVRSRSARCTRTVRFFAWVMEREADWLERTHRPLHDGREVRLVTYSVTPLSRDRGL